MAKAGYELLKAKKYDPLIARLVDRLGMEATATTWLNAEAWLDLLIGSAPPMSAAERQHVEGVILPTCAIYFAMGAQIGKEDAYAYLRDFLYDSARTTGGRFAGFFSIPGGRHLAMLVAGMFVQRRYGTQAGFASKTIESSPSRLQLEVWECTYLKWCEICGAPEIASLFCDCDDKALESVPKVRFQRKGTLARGDELCDFDFELS